MGHDTRHEYINTQWVISVAETVVDDENHPTPKDIKTCKGDLLDNVLTNYIMKDTVTGFNAIWHKYLANHSNGQ